jgi:hypothetical protein
MHFISFHCMLASKDLCKQGAFLGKRPTCCCHFIAWPTKANSLDGGATSGKRGSGNDILTGHAQDLHTTHTAPRPARAYLSRRRMTGRGLMEFYGLCGGYLNITLIFPKQLCTILHSYISFLQLGRTQHRQEKEQQQQCWNKI